MRSAPSCFAATLLLLGAIGLEPSLTRADVDTGHEYTFHHENVLGTSLELRVRSTSADAASAAESRVLAEIDRLAMIFSTYDQKSELARWMTDGRDGKVSTELFGLLQASDHWTRTTSGAFDPRVEALSRLWSNAARKQTLPTAAEITQARASLGSPAWSLDATTRTARRTGKAPLTFNAIAKGTIIDRASEAAFDADRSAVQGVLLMIGGDLRVRGQIGRKVGIAHPRGASESAEPLVTIEVREGALATSGDYMRGNRIQGNWYSHIIDSSTGHPAAEVIGASVLAPTAEAADALATAFSVLRAEQSLAIAESLPGVACLLIEKNGRVTKSSRWAASERPRVRLTSLVNEPAPQAKAAATTSPWPKDHELAVTFEINSAGSDARRYRRPYVAIWITDKDGLPVRTLVLWVQRTGLRWLPDLTRWYRDDQLRKLADEADLVQTVSKATRAPGKYQVNWDGKDDRGKPVSAGTYTLNIEVAREHGTHQLIRKDLALGEKPLAEDLKGNVEIKAAAFSYGKKQAGQ